MPASPWWVGQTYQPLVFTWTKDDAARSPVPLGGLTVEVWFQSTVDSARKFKGVGSLVVTDAPNGRFTYTMATSDVSLADEYDLQVKAYPTGNPSNPYYSDKFHIQVLQPIG